MRRKRYSSPKFPYLKEWKGTERVKSLIAHNKGIGIAGRFGTSVPWDTPVIPTPLAELNALKEKHRAMSVPFPFTVDDMLDKFKWFDRTFNPEPDTPEKAKREAEFEVFYRQRYAEEHPTL